MWSQHRWPLATDEMSLHLKILTLMAVVSQDRFHCTTEDSMGAEVPVEGEFPRRDIHLMNAVSQMQVLTFWGGHKHTFVYSSVD